MQAIPDLSIAQKMLLVLRNGISEVVARGALLNKGNCHSKLSQVDQLWHKRLICYYTSVWCPEEDYPQTQAIKGFAETQR